MNKCKFYKVERSLVKSNEITPNGSEHTSFAIPYCTHMYADKLGVSLSKIKSVFGSANALKCKGEEPDENCHLKELP
jgi:hypothetical protein